VQRVVQLVEHRRREHPDRLIALDLVQARPQSLGASGGLLRLRELRAQAKVVGADTEQPADEEGGGVVDDVVGIGEMPVSVPLRRRASDRTSKTT